MFKPWHDIIKEVFPIAYIMDSAFEYPIGPEGWQFNNRGQQGEDLLDWFEPDYPWGKGHVFINLQDMVTGTELVRLHDYLVAMNVPLEFVTVLCWPKRIQEQLPENSFNVINFSSHQYETWCSYKQSEDVLRDAFARDRKDFEFNWVCPQRIYKPHRAALHSVLRRYDFGNISLQSKGIELRYPSLTYAEYDRSYDNLVNLLAMKKNYNTALFSIVSESQYSERYGIITEKTFNSIVAGMPFLIAGHRNSLRDVTEYGFVSYPNLFDESYDDADNRTRIKTMLESNNRFTRERLSTVELQTYYDECSDLIEYNRNYFFEQFGDQLISELRLDLLNIWGHNPVGDSRF